MTRALHKVGWQRPARQARVPQRHDLIVVVLFALRIAHVSPQGIRKLTHDQ